MHQLAPDFQIHENGFFFGQLLDDENFLVPALNECIDQVNRFVQDSGWPEMVIPLKVVHGGPQSVLSELHGYFEKYCHDPRFQTDLRETLLLINIYIHRLEAFATGEKSTSAHIEVLPIPTRYLPLEAEDYHLFTPDWAWGELYLTYGITGVPKISGFWHNSDPRPQHCMSQGMLLGFLVIFPSPVTKSCKAGCDLVAWTPSILERLSDIFLWVF
jgi:hypothetical protein